MKLGAKLNIPVASLIESDLAAGKRGVKSAMTRATDQLKALLRDQVVSAGLGTRVANAWRGDTYPKGRDSLNAASYVWSKAPQIHSAFDEGALISRGGGLWLAIPTDNVPRVSSGGRGSGRPATPQQVEEQFNQDLKLVKDPNRPGLAYLVVNVVQAKNRRGWRRATDKRLQQGRNVESVIMFYLVRQVRLPKRLDIDAAVAQVLAVLPGEIALGWDSQR